VLIIIIGDHRGGSSEVHDRRIHKTIDIYGNSSPESGNMIPKFMIDNLIKMLTGHGFGQIGPGVLELRNYTNDHDRYNFERDVKKINCVIENFLDPRMFTYCYDIPQHPKYKKLTSENERLSYQNKNLSSELISLKLSMNEMKVAMDSLNTECIVCMNELDKNNMLCMVPCGHTNICEACIAEVKTCPNCRRLVDSKIKLFM
jgi:hypothetical protein